jgi:hypothetical protein
MADDEIRREIDRRFQEHHEEHRVQAEEQRMVRDSLAAIRQSLEQGSKTFARHEAELSALKPKAKTWLQLVVGSGAALGIVWCGVWLFADRPTDARVKEAIEEHAKGAHATTNATLSEMQQDVRQVQQDQAVMRAVQEDMHGDITEIKNDLKTVMRRQPRRGE